MSSLARARIFRARFTCIHHEDIAFEVQLRLRFQGASVAWEEVSIGLCVWDVLFFFAPFLFSTYLFFLCRLFSRSPRRDDKVRDLTCGENARANLRSTCICTLILYVTRAFNFSSWKSTLVLAIRIAISHGSLVMAAIHGSVPLLESRLRREYQ